MAKPIHDLNDLHFFAEVVAHGGFAPAGRALNQPKSKLSRRVAQLEERLGVRLIERSSRRFRVTEVGKAFYERCRAMMLEVQQAEAVIADAQGEPQGLVRVSCPLGLIEGPVSEALRAFMLKYPKVQLRLITSNQRFNLIDDNIDVAIRARSRIDTDMALILRTLRQLRFFVVAAPSLANKLGELREPHDLDRTPTISNFVDAAPDVWTLQNDAGVSQDLHHYPRFASTDIRTVVTAAIDGIGVAHLPDYLCEPWLERGSLVRVLPAWYTVSDIVHMVYTAKRGLPPAVRAVIDHLIHYFAAATPAGQRAAAIDPLAAFQIQNAE